MGQHGADMTIKAKYGRTARTWAMKGGRTEIAAFLEKKEEEKERRKCQRQWARVLSASSGLTTVADVPQLAPSKPLQQFLKEFPGLSAFIIRIVLSYFNNSTGLDSR